MIDSENRPMVMVALRGIDAPSRSRDAGMPGVQAVVSFHFFLLPR